MAPLLPVVRLSVHQPRGGAWLRHGVKEHTHILSARASFPLRIVEHLGTGATMVNVSSTSDEREDEVLSEN